MANENPTPTPVPKKVVKNFWNDPDGFSITDTLSLIFTFAFLGSAAVVLFMIFRPGTADNVIENSLNLLRILVNPILVIVGGYFTDQVATRFTSKRFGGENVNPDLDPTDPNNNGTTNTTNTGGDAPANQLITGVVKRKKPDTTIKK